MPVAATTPSSAASDPTDIYGAEGNDTVVQGTNAGRNLIETPLAGEDTSVVRLFGGRGIDTLSISLVAETSNVVLTGGSPDEEFDGTNLSLGSSSHHRLRDPEGCLHRATAPIS